MTDAQQPGPETVAPFAASVASKTPAPGGGAVAPVVGALGAALGSMVVAYSVSKKSLAEHRPALEQAAIKLARARELLFELASEDAAAYRRLNELWKLPEDDPKRVREMPAAARGAIAAPAAVAAACVNLVRQLEELVGASNPMLASDLAIAAVLAEAACRAAAWNVRINLPLLPDTQERSRAEQESLHAVAESIERVRKIESACA